LKKKKKKKKTRFHIKKTEQKRKKENYGQIYVRKNSTFGSDFSGISAEIAEKAPSGAFFSAKNAQKKCELRN
jgi:hypothetical protein